MTVTTYNENTQGHTTVSSYPTLSENSTFVGFDNDTQYASFFIIPVNYADTINFTIGGSSQGSSYDVEIWYTPVTAAELAAVKNNLEGDLPWQEAKSGGTTNLGSLSASSGVQPGFQDVNGQTVNSGSGYLIVEVEQNTPDQTDNYTLNMSNPALQGNPTDTFTTVGLSTTNSTTFSGTVADTNGATISSVKVYNNTTLLGTATVSNGTWTLTASLAANTYNQLNVIATDSTGKTKTANSPISLVATSSTVTTATFNAGSTGILDISGSTMPKTVISGFAPGDTIDLKNVDYDPDYGYSFVNPIGRQTTNTLQIVEEDTTYDLVLSSNYSGAGIEFSSDGGNGTDITLSAASSRVAQIQKDLGSKPYTFDNALAYIYKQAARANPTLTPSGTPIGFIEAALNKIIEERAMWDATTNSDNILVQVDHYLQEVDSIELYPNAINLAVQLFLPAAYDGLKLAVNGLASGSATMNVGQWLQGVLSTSQYPATTPSGAALKAAYNGILAGVLTTWEAAAQTAYNGKASLDPTFNVYDLQTSGSNQTITADNVNYYNIISTTTLPALTGNEMIVDNLVSNSPLTVATGNNLVIEYVGNKTVALGSGNNTVFLVYGNNVVDAGSGNSVVFAGGGNDTFVAGSGGASTVTNDFDGGAGWNNAVFGIASTAATITHNSNGSTTVTYAGGNDTFDDVEVIKFTNKSIALRRRATGDFLASNNSDVLFRNNSSGDTGFFGISSGANAGWSDIGASSTAYGVVGTGDFNGTGTDDILYRNNTTGDTGFYAISNGANTGWHDIGASSTAYVVVGVGDFNGNGTDDVLYRSATSGDTGFYAINNGVNTGWHDIGLSSTAYSVVGVGDFTGSGTDDVLDRNNTSGDTGFYAIVNGVNTGWQDIGASSTAYHVVG
jgi:hypothetical protein